MRAIVAIFFLLSFASSGAEEATRMKLPALMKAIVEIKIPKVNLKQATFEETVDYLAYQIQSRDPRQSELSGLSFLTNGPIYDSKSDSRVLLLEESRDKNAMNFSGKDVEVRKLMQECANCFEVSFHVTNVGVIITSCDGKPFPNGKAKKGTVYFSYKPKRVKQSVPPKSDRAGG